MNLQGQRILVTGGAGFIGAWTCELLAQKNPAAIVVIDNMIRGTKQNLQPLLEKGLVELVEGDIRDAALMEHYLAKTDVVFHLAALRITHCAEDPALAFQIMGQAFFTLLQLCVKYNIKRIVAASTASIYGLADSFPTDENHHAYSNRTLYGSLKLFNESLLRSFHEMYGLNYAATRYFNVYGSKMDIHGKYTEVLIRWMDRIDQGLPPIIFGDGLQTMDFVHVKDVARCNILLAQSDCVDEVFNVARGEEISLRALAETLMRVMGREDLKIDYQPERAVNPVPRRLADISKAQQHLNFSADIDLTAGLQELIQWRRERRAKDDISTLNAAICG